MATGEYQGILFPDRAENLNDFDRYKVFLDHWNPLGERLKELYEGVAIRRDTRALAIHGGQGDGKTLFANKLVKDFEHTKLAVAAGNFQVDANNLWHRIAGGHDLSDRLIRDATNKADILLIENNKNWVGQACAWHDARKDRHCIIVADNAERAYFRQGLVELSDVEFMQNGDTPGAMKMAAQKFVALCRTSLRGSLIVMFSNDDIFLLGFQESVDQQHVGLVVTMSLPLPNGSDKETIIRVNTNRLNKISYWYCLDKAGPDEKRAVRSALMGDDNYPDSFKAVDTAIRTATAQRVGRPARKNQITLIVFSNQDVAVLDDMHAFGEIESIEVQYKWAFIATYNKGWTAGIIGNERESRLLDSEWRLRLVILGTPFLASLLSGEPDHIKHCQDMIERLKDVYGPGTRHKTKEENEREYKELIDQWPVASTSNLQSFWQKGQTRSNDYEPPLAQILPGYNTGSGGFLHYRPDYIVTEFTPCSVTSALSDEIEAINQAIRRLAHVFEFTAIKDLTAERVGAYLKLKLPNYVEITQEQ